MQLEYQYLITCIKAQFEDLSDLSHTHAHNRSRNVKGELTVQTNPLALKELNSADRDGKGLELVGVTTPEDGNYYHCVDLVIIWGNIQIILIIGLQSLWQTLLLTQLNYISTEIWALKKNMV